MSYSRDKQNFPLATEISLKTYKSEAIGMKALRDGVGFSYFNFIESIPSPR